MLKTIGFVIRILLIGFVFRETTLRAQVHFTNGVDHVNLPLHPGFNLVGLELEPTNHTISSLFGGLEEGTAVYQLVQGMFTTNTFKNGQWERPNQTISLGEGVLILNPSPQPRMLVYGGAIVSGVLTNTLPPGLSIRCGMIPMTGKLTRELVLKLSPFDNLYQVSNGALKVFTYLPGNAWKPEEPEVLTGESFMLNLAKPVDWVLRSGTE